jgi:hypothetical protein
VVGYGGKGAVPVLVFGQVDEGVVHGDHQVETLPERRLAHVRGQEVDVREAREPPSGHRDHLRRELQRHDAARGAGEEHRGAAGAGPELEDPAARRPAGRPLPERPVATVSQLLVVEREDAVVVVLDLVIGHRASSGLAPEPLGDDAASVGERNGQAGSWSRDQLPAVQFTGPGIIDHRAVQKPEVAAASGLWVRQRGTAVDTEENVSGGFAERVLNVLYHWPPPFIPAILRAKGYPGEMRIPP